MPELPEAESIARFLRRTILGRRLKAVHVKRTDIIHGDGRSLEVLLPGRRIVAVERRAKRVEIAASGGVRLIFRLGMSGRITIAPSASFVEPHTHVRFLLSGRREELRFRDPRRFGGLWCLTPATRRHGYTGRQLGEVGLEPLTATPAPFRCALTRRRQIKALLMDQAVIAGLGNIYCDESLYAARIHPLTIAASLNRVACASLLRAVQRTLNRAIAHNGSTLADYRNADGEPGSFQRLHRVYQREGRPCRRCRTPIVRILAAGRSTFFCPACQKLN